MNWLLFLGLGAAGFWFYETKIKKNPVPSPAVTDPQSLADAKQMLAAWAATQGAQFSATDPLAYWVQLFQVWANKGGVQGSTLRTDGILDAATLATLQYWFQHQSTPVAAHH